MKIPVTFVIDKAGDRRQVAAVFPSRETHPTNSAANRVCYAHIGQHSECSMQWVQENTRSATPAEYAPLLSELRGVYEGDGVDVLEVVAP